MRHYPAHDLLAWQPQGVLDDRLLDEIWEWLSAIEDRHRRAGDSLISVN
jgi:hypothetical protein